MNFPDFELKSRTLQMEESFYYDESGVLIMMEPEYGSYIRIHSSSDWSEMLYDYDTVFITDETTVLIKNNGEINTYDYPKDFQISRDWMYDKINYIYVFVAVFLVFSYLFSFMGYFLTALFVELVEKLNNIKDILNNT